MLALGGDIRIEASPRGGTQVVMTLTEAVREPA
jgi:hypothetical protein